MWRVVCAAVLFLGCESQNRAAEKTPPTSPPPVAAPADATIVADAAVSIDASTPTDAAVGGAKREPPSGKAMEKKGEGACKTDADCELSVWQQGCCLTTCEGYAISKKLLAERKAKENCPPKGTVMCPPPSPCPLLSFLPERAVCKSGRCTAVGKSVDGPPR